MTTTTVNATMVDVAEYHRKLGQIAQKKAVGEVRLGDRLEVIKSTAAANDLESRRDFELEISCLVPD